MSESEPSFGSLLRGNLRVCTIALFSGLACYAIWRLLRVLFPDIGWLQ